MEAWAKHITRYFYRGNYRMAEVYKAIIAQACFSSNKKRTIKHLVWRYRETQNASIEPEMKYCRVEREGPEDIIFGRYTYKEIGFESWDEKTKQWGKDGLPVPPYPWPTLRAFRLTNGRIEKVLASLDFECPFCGLRDHGREKIFAQWVMPGSEIYHETILCFECTRMHLMRMREVVASSLAPNISPQNRIKLSPQFSSNARKRIKQDRAESNQIDSDARQRKSKTKKHRRALEIAAYEVLNEMGMLKTVHEKEGIK